MSASREFPDSAPFKGQPPAVLLGHLTALAKAGQESTVMSEQKYPSDTGSNE